MSPAAGARLTDRLRDEHRILLDLLNEVRKLGTTTTHAQKRLRQGSELLVAHLEREDRELYPVLRAAAEKDPGLRSDLEVFARDLERVSSDVQQYLQRYSAGGSGIDFGRATGYLIAVLTDRIRREELVLYARYDELQDKRRADGW